MNELNLNNVSMASIAQQLLTQKQSRDTEQSVGARFRIPVHV